MIQKNTLSVLDGVKLDHLSAELRGDIEGVAQFIDELKRGELTEDEFKPKRLRFGVYGQRQPGVQMIRIKLPYGGVRPDHLRALADAADTFSTGIAHATTRQDFQLHFVKFEEVIPLLVKLAESGLTTREA
jgi:sulfite reductase beta subunit-like hemoprotein